MIYYMTNICQDCINLKNRGAKFSAAGINRSNYILDNINADVEVVSLAIPTNKGVFRAFSETDNRGIFKTTYYFPFSLNFAKLKYISIMIDILIRLFSKVKKNDTILCYNANIMYVIPIMICKLLKGTAIIYEIEELYNKSGLLSGIKSTIMKLTENYMLKFSDGYIYVNNYMLNHINKSKPSILNVGYMSHMDIAEKKITEKNIIVYCGRLDDEGGIELFLKSLQYIKMDIKVIITGDGVLRTKVEDFIKNQNLLDIKYLGFVTDEELILILNSATVCVNPLRLENKFSYYSFPSKVLTYLSYGCNVVTSKSIGIMPLLDKFENIFAYTEDSEIIIAETIKKAIIEAFDRSNNILSINMFFNKQNKELQNFLEEFVQ